MLIPKESKYIKTLIYKTRINTDFKQMNTDNNKNSIKKILLGIKENVLLAKYTTFKVGGLAKYFFIAKSNQDIIKAVGAALQCKVPFFILGGGSNLLISDKGFWGLVIKVENSNLQIKKSKIFVEAGVSLSEVVKKAVKNNLTGMEWAVGIPGTVGGAIRGNAGAFGAAICDSVKKVKALEIIGKKSRIKELTNKNCKFNYRESIFKKKQNIIILSAELELKKGNKEKIEKEIKENLKIRNKKQPHKASAGSIFKNKKSKIENEKLIKLFPGLKTKIVKKVIPSAALIEMAGLSGKKIGNAQISKVHKNFIVNLGRAKSTDVKKLIDLIKKKVKNKFGVNLEEEIKIIC